MTVSQSVKLNWAILGLKKIYRAKYKPRHSRCRQMFNGYICIFTVCCRSESIICGSDSTVEDSIVAGQRHHTDIKDVVVTRLSSAKKHKKHKTHCQLAPRTVKKNVSINNQYCNSHNIHPETHRRPLTQCELQTILNKAETEAESFLL